MMLRFRAMFRLEAVDSRSPGRTPRSMIGLVGVVGALAAGAIVGSALVGQAATPGPRSEPAEETAIPQGALEQPVAPRAVFNDNLRLAGTLEDGTLTLALEVVEADWPLLGDDRPPVRALAFREIGRSPEIPGPLIRVPAGTEVRVAVRNPLAKTLVVHGLASRGETPLDSLVVPPGERREARFTADLEGTFYYGGSTTGVALDDRHYEDSPLSGALIVDPPGGSPPDRVLMLGVWFGGEQEDGEPDFAREFLTINGRPWPLTERLVYQVGERIHWRVINASPAVHPMHLHGFFYRVDARGDLASERPLPADRPRMAVTELLAPGETMRMTWTPERPGGWLFHCHLAWHVVENPPGIGPEAGTVEEREARLLRGHQGGDFDHHVVEGMGGLMMAVTVPEPPGWRPPLAERREMRLFIQADSVAGDERPRFGYVLQEGAQPAPDSIRVPGSPLILRQGEPTTIRVFNRSGEPSQIHWHGVELESYYDGAAGVSGMPGRLTPAIAPGDSFEVRVTPPRPGSFMYHTHVNDIRQQTAGLYAAFIVLDPGEEWDPEIDRIMLASNTLDFGVLLDGSGEPPPQTMRVGSTYRLRLMNITIHNPRLRFRLLRDGQPESWRRVAKDGWELSETQREAVKADLTVTIGETVDVEYRADEPGELRLQLAAGNGELFVERRIEVLPR